MWNIHELEYYSVLHKKVDPGICYSFKKPGGHYAK